MSSCCTVHVLANANQVLMLRIARIEGYGHPSVEISSATQCAQSSDAKFSRVALATQTGDF